MNKEKLKECWQFFCDWSEVFVLLPVTLTLLIFNSQILSLVDPEATVQVVDMGYIAALTGNVLLWLVVSVLGYWLAQITFGFDRFQKAFWEQLTPWEQAKASLTIWIFTIIYTCYIIIPDIRS
jgi:hypothetical protein